jgi:hypothetical protein
MAISTTFQPISIPALNGTRTVAFNFPFFASSDLKVYVNGVLQTIGTNYSVTGGNGASGTVTLNEANAGGPQLPCSVIIDLAIPNTQEANFTVAGPLPGLTLNLLFDRLTMLIQQLSSRVSRVLRFTVTSPVQNELALTAPGVVGSINGTSVAMLTGTQLAELINLQGSQVNRPTRTFTDQAARAIAVPDFVGQLGIQLDQSGTEALYRSTNITAGSWANIGTQVASSIAVGAVGAPQIAAGAVQSEKILEGAVIGTKIAAGAVDATKIAAKSITQAQIADSTITAALINGKAFGTAQIAADAITGTELANNAVTVLKIADGSVSTAKIEAGAVIQAKIAAGAVGSNQIADGAVGPTKLDQSINFGIAKLNVLTSGTNAAFTPLNGVRALMIECIGGGGGSGGANAASSGHVSAGGSGGSGGYSKKFHVIEANQTFKYTVGAAGAAGYSGSAPAAGGNGGTSSFTGTIGGNDTVLCLANGGTGGGLGTSTAVGSTTSFRRNGGVGAFIGVPSIAVGDIILTGNQGQPCFYVGSAGPALIGEGGTAPVYSSLTYGTGGLAQVNTSGQSALIGKVGASGVIIVTEFY